MQKMNQLRRLAAGGLAAVLLLLAPAAQAAQGKVNTSSLVLRKSASKTSKALQTLDRGDTLEVLSSTGDWYKVSYGKYTGYVMKQYVKVSGKVEEQTTAKEESKQSIADLGDAPATSRPGDTGSHVKKLQQALQIKGHYKGKIDGIYGSGTTAAVKAFQKKHGLSRDGIAGKVTIKTLFGQNAADDKAIQTESLKWFGSENTIPKGATVTIKDVLTGKTFTAVRWSGANHMDTEPASKEDTATMKSIYGGSWSWTRRPILVKYNGHVYAASMNGMPHGTSTISNGFNGHFCIHFTGSKTHETNRVDSDHQDCVKEALKATW
ncbi:MAG: peptidoglycan-binding protein [Clostridia bacterium]|nr:peptidoglycan-binding protein [Clostridia bacterium]